MNRFTSFNRRRFLQAGLLSTTGLAGAALPGQALGSLTKLSVDPCHGLKLGVTTYTFHKFKVDQAIAHTAEAGFKYISIKDVHLPLKSTREQRQEVRGKIEQNHLTLLGGGVIYYKNDPEQIRNVFEYAKDLGMPTIICSPEPDALDATEKLVKEYDLRIAIHNHGPGDKKYPSPLDVLRMVKDRDARMGICMDVGHTVRIRQDPVEAIKKCASRLYDFHMKDITAAVPDAKAVPVGKGVIDIAAVLKTLLKIKYAYHVALEYEADEADPMPGIKESFAFMRGVLAATA